KTGPKDETALFAAILAEGINLGLSKMADAHQNEKESLLVAMKTTKTKRMYERYQTIYFYVQGFSIKDITNMIGRSEKTIYNYVNAYKDKGLNGLLMGQSTGAPRKLAPEQEQELVQVIASQLPAKCGA
ncbi:terminase gpP N-terminus-related DNA-binding protein, partial [Escherichia sp. R-CC3]